MPIAAKLLRTAKKAADNAASASIQLVLPPVCRLCDDPIPEGDDFCLGCSVALGISEPIMKSACTRCGSPRPQPFLIPATGKPVGFSPSDPTEIIKLTGPTVSRPFEKVSSKTLVPENHPQSCNSDDMAKSCPHCRKLNFAFERVVTRWSYQGVVCDAIIAAKYVNHSPLGDALGRRLGDIVSEQLSGDLPDVVTFVPSNLSRQFSRGGNGVQAIAQAVSRRLSLFSSPVKCRQLLRTTRRIKKQAWLDDGQRQANVCGAFAVRRRHTLNGLPSFANRHILLVDDVLTTGATANEVSRVLVQAGANRVTLAVLARAIRAN